MQSRGCLTSADWRIVPTWAKPRCTGRGHQSAVSGITWKAAATYNGVLIERGGKSEDENLVRALRPKGLPRYVVPGRYVPGTECRSGSPQFSLPAHGKAVIRPVRFITAGNEARRSPTLDERPASCLDPSSRGGPNPPQGRRRGSTQATWWSTRRPPGRTEA
jgi:hypothetical protein